MEDFILCPVGRPATRGEGGGGLPCPFFENKKKCPDFRKESPDCVRPYIKFTIQNAVLRVSKRKNFEKFPCEAFFTGSFDELFIGVP